MVAAGLLAISLGNAGTAQACWTQKVLAKVARAESSLASTVTLRTSPTMPEHVPASDRDNYVELLSKAGIAHFSWTE
jgi:hypothetical protein